MEISRSESVGLSTGEVDSGFPGHPRQTQRINMKSSGAAVSAGAALTLCLMAHSAVGAVTPYSWIRAGEANNVFLDSSGNGKNFNAGFSSGCVAGAGGGGNPAAVIVPIGAGGPLGPSGAISTSATRWGSFGCANSGMWLQGPNNTVPTPDLWSLPATNWVMEAWVLPVNDGASGFHTASQFLSTGSPHFGGRPGGAAFRTQYNPGDNTITISAHSIGPAGADNFVIGEPVVTDTNRWIHVAVVNDNGVTTFYTNGVASGSSTNGVTAPSGVPYIGSGEDTGTPFDGYLDEIRYSTFAPAQFQVTDLLLRPAGPNIIGQPQSATVWAGGAAPFEVQTAFDVTTTYQWQRGGAEIFGETSPELFLSSVAVADSGSVFNVVVSNSGIDLTSSNATLTVAPVQTANVDFYRAAVNGESSLVAYFPVDGSTGLTVANTEDPTHEGTLSFSGGYDGRTNRAFGERALRFTGNNEVTVAADPRYEFASGAGTVEAIVYLAGPSAAGNATIFSVATSPTAAYYQVQASRDGSALVYKNDILAQALSWPVPVSLLGRFAHVAMVFGDNTVTAYVDGQSLGSKPHSNFGAATGLQANIGSSGRDFNGVLQDPWVGTVDELAIYGSALSANTIAVHNSRFIYGTAVTAPTIDSVPTGTKTLLAGGAPVFRVRASGTAPLSYQWKRNGVAVAGNPSAATANLTLNNSTAAMSGDYTVTVSNPIGEVTSTAFTVNFTAAPDLYSSYVLSNNPSAYWRLNETGGTTLIDSAGGIDGAYATTVDRNVAGAPGVGDPAAHFSGGGTPVPNAIVPYTPTLNPTGPFTIEFWVKPDQSGQNSRAVIGNQNRNTGRAGYAVYQGFNGNFWEAHLGYADTVLFIQGQTPPVAGRWDHIAVTWDGVNTSRIYVNGRDETSPGSTVNGPHRPNLSVPLEIASRFGGGIPYPGTIDEIAFYNHQLTPEQIEQHWSVSWAPAQVVTQPTNVPNALEATTITLFAVVSGYPNTYQWFKDFSPLAATTNPDGTPHYPQGVNSTNLVISQVTPADAGVYQLVISNRLGDLETVEVTVNVDLDMSPPTVSFVTADSSMNRVRVKFSRPVTPETAGVAANYALSGGVTATNVVLTTDPSLVDVVTTSLTPGTQYNLVVTGVRDTRTSQNLIGPNNTSFMSYVRTPGVLAWDYYERIPGTSVEALQASPRFPDGVYTNGVLTNFSTMPLTGGDLNGNPGFGPQNLGSDYGLKVYGWITPTVGGNYTFFLRSDDASQLWLSTSDDPATKEQIAVENGCCQPFQETGPQTSTAKALVAGQRYYIEALNKEAGGGDYLEVAWRLEGDTTAAANLRPIAGSFLSANAPVSAPRFNTVVRNAGQLTISWTGSGILQESSDLRNWAPVAGNPAGSYSVTPAPGTVRFYRLAP
jgi:hypothetical protein